MKQRILFVDDEPNVLAGLRRMLHGQRQVWELSFAPSARAALGELRAAAFDAIVLDVRLGDADGLELLAALRATEDTSDLPVIMLTGLYDTGLKRRALELGATDLLDKPVDPDELVARLRNVLRLKSYQDELKTFNENLRRQIEQRTAQLEESRLDIVLRLAKAGEYRDDETGNHVARVAAYCRSIAEELGTPPDFVDAGSLASSLHDIGKIGIPDRILLKPGKLVPCERKIIEQHCAIGAAILLDPPKGAVLFQAWQGMRSNLRRARLDNGLLQMASSIALGHHERWDGGGYPMGLAGEDIPPESRITALADVYDALCSDRPYRPAYPEDEVIRIVTEEGEEHFGPDVFATFGRLVEEFRSIREQLSDESPVPAGVRSTSR